MTTDSSHVLEQITRPELGGLLEELLRKGAGLRIRVSGFSMRPFLNGGELVTIQPMAGAQPRTGDIILFRAGDQGPILHRIVSIRTDRNQQLIIQTKGDSSATFDVPLTCADILGRVVQVEREDGKCKPVDLNQKSWRLRSHGLAVLSLMRWWYFNVLKKTRKTICLL